MVSARTRPLQTWERAATEAGLKYADVFDMDLSMEVPEKRHAAETALQSMQGPFKDSTLFRTLLEALFEPEFAIRLIGPWLVRQSHVTTIRQLTYSYIKTRTYVVLHLP